MAPTSAPGLTTATTTATPAMPATAMVAVRGKHLAAAPGTSERAQYAHCVEHRRDGSQFRRHSDRVRHLQDQQGRYAHRVEHRRDRNRFRRHSDRVRHLQDQQGHQAASLQRAGQDRDHGVASVRQHRPLGVVARGNYHFMVKYSNHCNKLEATYFISTRTRRCRVWSNSYNT